MEFLLNAYPRGVELVGTTQPQRITKHDVTIQYTDYEMFKPFLDDEDTGHESVNLLDAVTGCLLVLYVNYDVDFRVIKSLAKTLATQYILERAGPEFVNAFRDELT